MIKKTRFFYSILFISLFFACSKDESNLENPLNDENFILNFELPINGQSFQGNINDTSNIITFNTQNVNLDNLTPSITISAKSSISPLSNVAQDFESPIFYTVTAENGDERTYKVSVNNTMLNGDNQLVFFSLNINGEEISGEIDEYEKTVTFNLAGAELDGLTPTVEISENATISPSTDTPQNFNDLVAYTIIASNGTPSIYRIIVNNRPLSEENSISFFSVSDGNTVSEANIDEESGIISFNFGALDRSNLTSEIIIPEYAKISPEIGSIQDFSEPITYEVIAENGDKKSYLVIANLPRISFEGFGNVNLKFFSGAQLGVVGNFIDLSVPESKVQLYDGTNKYPLDIVSTSNELNGLIENSRIIANIPDSTPTSTSYRVVYEGSDFEYFSDYYVDIKQENSPLPLTVDKAEYNYNDELIITGENLTEYIRIPSLNGSLYQFSPFGSQIEVNSDGTVLTVLLDRRPIFPSYFGSPAQEMTVYFLDEDGRSGKTIQATFN